MSAVLWPPLPELVRKHGTLYQCERAFRRRLILRALDRARGNRTSAARALGIQRSYLLRLMRTLAIQDGLGSILRQRRHRARRLRERRSA